MLDGVKRTGPASSASENMGERLRPGFFARMLFYGTLGLAASLAVLVLVAPVLGSEDEHRLLAMFAQDSTVRKTALASALGLAVTAFVFFRPGLLLNGQKSRGRRPPPNSMAGA